MIGEQLLWHLNFFLFWCIPSLIVYLIILFYLVKRRREVVEFPQECYLEKVIGKRYYTLKCICVVIIICEIFLFFLDAILVLFIASVIFTGLVLTRHLFYKYKTVYSTYEEFIQNPLKYFIPHNSEKHFQKQLQLRWNQIKKASILHFNHPIVFIFVFLEFIFPAFYFGYFDGGIPLAVLLAIEYYFIGMSLWVSSIGTGIIYWLGRFFPLRVSQDMERYNSLGKLAIWTVTTIAVVPGMGVPAVANIELILSSSPVQVALFWYTIANITIFLTGFYGVHKGMTQSKQWLLRTISNELSLMTFDLVNRANEKKWMQLDEKEKTDLRNFSLVLQSFKGIYETAHSLSEWPLTKLLKLVAIVSSSFPWLFTIFTDLFMQYLKQLGLVLP